MKTLRRSFVVWLFVAASMAAAQAPTRVAVLGPEGPFREAVSARLAEGLGAAARFVAPVEAEVLVALGNEAFEQALARDKPVFAGWVDRHLVVEARAAGCTCTAVWPYADPDDQLELVRGLLPGARRIGVLYDEHTADQLGALRAAARARQLVVVEKRLDSAARPAAALAEVLRQSDLLLALPDAHLYTAANARLLLMTSYRHGRPVIGPDEQWVRAGSLASAWVSRDGIVAALVRQIQAWLEKRIMPGPRYAASRASVNEHVARAHGVAVPERFLLEGLMEDRP